MSVSRVLQFRRVSLMSPIFESGPIQGEPIVAVSPKPSDPAERWRRCKRIVCSMLNEDRQTWPALLMEYCGDDVDLFLDVACLIRLSPEIGDFIEEPALRKVLP